MKDNTKMIHQRVCDIGRAIGFTVLTEAQAGKLMPIRGRYRPRADVIWAIELTVEQLSALQWASGCEFAEDQRLLPVVCIEVEGTKPTTKTMESDVANIVASGAPYGLLVVSEGKGKNKDGEAGIYRRAARVIRTLRRAFGDRRVIPLEASWLDHLAKLDWDDTTGASQAMEGMANRGNESLDWTHKVRAELSQQGRGAGFEVIEEYHPSVLEAYYSHECSIRQSPLEETVKIGRLLDDASRTRRTTKWKDYYTAARLDLAWNLALPHGMTQLMERVAEIDPRLVTHGIIPETSVAHLTVAGFELESHAGKHAGGSLLNLGAYSAMGVLAVPPENRSKMVEVLETYRPTLGLRNVFVRSWPR